jgi:hypothetical protein
MKNQKGFSVVVIVAIIAVGMLAGFLTVLLGKAKDANQKVPVIPPSPSAQVQGVKATIRHITGDCMPKTGGSPSKCYTQTFTEPLTVMIKQNSNVVKQIPQVKGQFQLELPAGTYSMYIVYKDKEYCTSTDRNGVPCAFTVEPNKLTNYTFDINEATY